VSRGRRGAAAALLLAGWLALPARAAAQFLGRDEGFLGGNVEAGPRVGRDFKHKAWTVGAQLGLRLGSRLELRPSGDLLFPKDQGMGWQLNGDAAVRLGQGGGLYGGGGVALVHPHDAGTDTGYNLFFGVSTAPPQQRTKGFLEFRWTFVNDASAFRLSLGFMYRL
jgi:hypothetical protein